MGKIVVSENVSLDGVIQDPAGDQGFRVGGWVGLIGNSPQLAKLALDQALAAGAFLRGRRSYEWLGARGPSPIPPGTPRQSSRTTCLTFRNACGRFPRAGIRESAS